MCGIIAVLGVAAGAESIRPKVLERAKRIRHRGPDWTGIYLNGKNVIAHERLAIVDVMGGAQPLYSDDRKQVLGVNGEIYNHKQLRNGLKKPVKWATDSDCECIIHLYNELGLKFINALSGIFAFVLVDEATDTFVIARDHMGIIPLYYGWDESGSLWVTSELKGLHDVCVRFEEFPPGHVLSGAIGTAGKLDKWYLPVWHDEKYIPTAAQRVDFKALHDGLELAVKKQLMTDVPYGVLLSGGLDSSIISALAVKHAAKRVEDDEKTQAWWPRVHSFSIGLKGSPDLKAAKEVADFIKTQHHEFTFTVQEGIDALNDVIHTLETFDTTTVRASTPMYLLSRRIKTMGVKMVLSGEGADEIFGGYLYFHKAPNRDEFHKETVRKLKSLHKYDCLRANKSTMAFGLEARVPFLDKEFMDLAMTIDPTDKMCGVNGGGRMEKWIVRKAFEGYLPQHILWRQKEQFSDGVGYNWIDSLKAHAEKTVSDKMFIWAKDKFPENTPVSKEAYLYRSIFEKHFPQPSALKCVPGGPSIACSTPTAIAWDKAFQNMADPSGRSVAGVHSDAYVGAHPDSKLDHKSATTDLATGVRDDVDKVYGTFDGKSDKKSASTAQNPVATSGVNSEANTLTGVYVPSDILLRFVDGSKHPHPEWKHPTDVIRTGRKYLQNAYDNIGNKSETSAKQTKKIIDDTDAVLAKDSSQTSYLEYDELIKQINSKIEIDSIIAVADAALVPSVKVGTK